MVYTTDLLYANHRGYTSWAAFADANTIPTATAIIEMRKTANALVNMAYHNSEADSAVHTATLKQYEMVVMDRIIADAYLIDRGEVPKNEFLSVMEFELLSDLGNRGGDTIKSVSMYDKTNPFRRGILY